jgi:hypothetical protein
MVHRIAVGQHNQWHEKPAHVIGDMAEQAYCRSDALEKRRLLMEQWAACCRSGRAEKVVMLAARAAI